MLKARTGISSSLHSDKSKKLSAAVSRGTIITIKANSFNFGDVTSYLVSKATEAASDMENNELVLKADGITSFLGSVATDGITLAIPALPTLSVDTAALQHYVSSVGNKLGPDVISSIRRGETPAAVSQFVEGLASKYQSVARAAWSDVGQIRVTPTARAIKSNASDAVGGGGGSGSSASTKVGLTAARIIPAVVIGAAGLAVFL